MQEVENFVHTVIAALPAKVDRLQQYREAQTNDVVCSQLKTYCTTGWPDKHHLPSHMQPYWNYQGELTVVDNLLL